MANGRRLALEMFTFLRFVRDVIDRLLFRWLQNRKLSPTRFTRPTRRNATVSPGWRRRCELGIRVLTTRKSCRPRLISMILQLAQYVSTVLYIDCAAVRTPCSYKMPEFIVINFSSHGCWCCVSN